LEELLLVQRNLVSPCLGWK